MAVSVTGPGRGMVTSSPAGISCGMSCEAAFAQGAEITLTATPASGSQVVSWGGSCQGTARDAPCVLTASGTLTVDVAFGRAASPGGGSSPAGGTWDVCTIRGTAGPDVLNGTVGPDVICGLGGDDLIRGLAGRDRLYGGAGDDRILGGAGRDRLYGGRGDDRSDGGSGQDVCTDGIGRNALVSCAPAA